MTWSCVDGAGVEESSVEQAGTTRLMSKGWRLHKFVGSPFSVWFGSVQM